MPSMTISTHTRDTEQARAERQRERFGCTVTDLEDMLRSPDVTPAVAALSLILDAQVMLESGQPASAQQRLNCAKWMVHRAA